MCHHPTKQSVMRNKFVRVAKSVGGYRGQWTVSACTSHVCVEQVRPAAHGGFEIETAHHMKVQCVNRQQCKGVAGHLSCQPAVHQEIQDLHQHKQPSQKNPQPEQSMKPEILIIAPPTAPP